MVDNNDELYSNVTIDISLYLRGVYVARKIENVVKLTHSRQTCIESRHSLYIWLRVEKILLYLVCLYSLLCIFAVCQSSNAQVIDHMKQFA